MTSPLVSVILIGYNDAVRIVRALDSLRNQTLRSIEIIVVDDASTDATVDVVSTIAAADPRVRIIARTQNSGGCSAPRNDGLAAATAPWVMFCDSDDEYERHACATMLFAAEDWDADIVCGLAVRHDVGKVSDKPWRPQLHERDRIVQSLEAEPDLLYDTISVNKIYRRSMLVEHDIRFPPGLLFEDQVFTLRCFLAARRIGIVQARVYIWNVDRAAEEVSITQGRMQPRNVVDRVEINRLMDEVLSASSDALRLAKAIKFLRHEGYLYLWAIAENPDTEAAQRTAGIFGDYVRNVDPRAFDHVRPALRVALYGLLIDDLDLLRRAMRWERWASVVDTRIVVDGDRQLWAAPTGRVALGRSDDKWLDVTSLHLMDMPFSTRRYFHELVEFDVRRARVLVRVETADYAQDLDPATEAHLVWVDKGGSPIASLPLRREPVDRVGRVGWFGEGQPTVHIDRPLMRPDKGSVAIRLSRGRHANTTAVRSVNVAVDSLFIPLPSVAFADRPSGAKLLAGERAGVAWRPGGVSRGPVSWARRLAHALRRRLPGAGAGPNSTASAPGVFDLPTDRPVVAYIPAPSVTRGRGWPLDLSLWNEQMADTCYLLAGGEIDESVPTRLWGAVRDARNVPLVQILDSCSLLITDDPALIESTFIESTFAHTTGPAIVFRPDEGAARYLLPTLPTGYSVIETTEDLIREVRDLLARST